MPRTKIEMTDDELGRYLAPAETDEYRARLVEAVRRDPAKVALFNKMAALEVDLSLYSAGLAPKPDYAIICGDDEINHGGTRKRRRK